MQNVTIYDNGACFMLCVDGLQVMGYSTLGDAWNHVVWMYRVASQKFTVGHSKVPVTTWIGSMVKAGFLEENDGFEM